MPNYADSYSSLEGALKAMMRKKMLSPNVIVMLYPADVDMNKKWDDAGHMVGVSTLTEVRRLMRNWLVCLMK